MIENKDPKISFILATYNEKETIGGLIARVLQVLGDDVELIVVDDNSPDGTAELIRNIGDSRVSVVERKKGRGLASAYMRGLIESRGRIICWMDADGCMPVEMVPQMIDRLDNGADAVVGSRFAPGGKDDRDFYRILASKMIIGFARSILGCQTLDIDSGFMVMKREALNGALFSPTGYGEYFIELVYNLERKGYRVEEMGYVFRDRAEDEGQSKSFNSWLNFIFLGCKYGLRVLRCRIWPLDK